MIPKSKIDDRQVDRIRHLIPGPEPVLRRHAEPRGEGVRQVIPVSEPSLCGNELKYVTECIQSNWISSAGPFVQKFEERFAAEMGCKFGVSCTSGTTALHLALAVLGITAGDEVIIPTFTMIATANTVRYTGATPVLVDSEPDTWNIDVRQIESKITPRTKAIVVVHVYGHPADMDPILEIAKRRRLYVIEDAAEAHGAEYHGRKVGSLGDAACFSFYANKIITTGEGGMLTTNNEEIAHLASKLRGHAFSEERHFWHEYQGFNYRMTNLQAAVGLAQTERLSELVERRRWMARLYDGLLRDVPGLVLPMQMPEVRSVSWMYGVLVAPEFGENRDGLRKLLADRGIETRTFFIPIHLQPVYFERGEQVWYPVAESLCQKGLYLPSSGTLTEAEIRYVAGEVRAVQRDAVSTTA